MTITTEVQESGRPAARSNIPRLALASGVGTSLEFYDFALYGTAAALVFNQIFFISEDPWFGTFMGLATFAIGFLMAPVGAVLFGWIGDRFGRKTSLMLTFMAMGVATLLMGLLPSYLAIGIAAPLMLVVLRMFHGLSRGGEIGGAAVLAVEHAPANRRALYGSFVALGSPLGMLMANMTFSLVLFLPMEQVVDWGWRLPFLFGGVVFVIGLWVRRGVHETPVFEALQDERAATAASAATTSSTAEPRTPFAKAVRENWKSLLLAAGVNLGLNANMFILATFMLSYATAPAPRGLGLARQAIVNGSVMGLVAHALTILVGCWLADRYGRKVVMMPAAAAALVYALVMFRIADIGTVGAVNVAVLIGFAITGFLFGPLITYFTELFTPEQRQSGMGIAYQVGAVLGGGLSPLIANRLVAATGESTSVGWYLAALLSIALVCLALLPETAPVRRMRAARVSA